MMRVLMAVCFMFCGILLASQGLAADYPTRNVEIIVPWGPGSNADLLARIVAPLLDKKFNQPFVVVNKTGAAGILAHNYVLKVGALCGFSVDEATNAQRVLIVGDTSAVSAEDEAKLVAAGCQVSRLSGDSYAVERAFADLMA